MFLIRYCMIPNCGNSSNKNDKTVRFHQISKKAFSKWVELLQLEGVKSNNDDNQIIYVCSKHFKRDDYRERHCRRVLKRGVLPTIGIPTNKSNIVITSVHKIDATKAVAMDDDSSHLHKIPKDILATQEAHSQDTIENLANRIQPSQNLTSDPPEEGVTIENTTGEKLTIKEIINKDNPLQKRIFVKCGEVEYTMTPKSMRKMCRICFSTENLSCMFSTTYRDIKMCDIMGKFTNRLVPQGRLSRNLCLKCIKSLGQLHKFMERCKLAENLMRLSHKLFFGTDISILDSTSPYTVTPSTSYTQTEINKYLTKKRKYMESTINVETDQEQSEEMPTPEKVFAEATENICDEELEGEKRKSKEIVREGPILKKLKIDHSRDTGSPKSANPITLLKRLDKQSLINAQNFTLTTVKVPVKQGSFVTLSKKSISHATLPSSGKATDQSADSKDKIQLSKRTITKMKTLETSNSTTKKDNLVGNGEQQSASANAGLYKCVETNCKKVFTSVVERARHNLNMHVISHCDICVSTHVGQRRLKIHFFKVHSLGTSYKCSMCESVFGKGATYLVHKKDCKTLMGD